MASRTRAAHGQRFAGQARGQVQQRALEQGEVERRAVVEVQALVVQPLPQLRARDLRSRRVLHQVVDRHAAVAVQPRGEVAHADLDVVLETLARDRAERHAQQVIARRRHVRAQVFVLVRAGHMRIERCARDRDQRRVRDPGAVVAGGDLALFVRAHFRHRGVVGLGVAADRDLRGHAAHRVRAAAVAGVDQQSEYAFRNGCAIVTWPRSGSTRPRCARRVLMQERCSPSARS